jgi:hypothetical protein
MAKYNGGTLPSGIVSDDAEVISYLSAPNPSV